MKSKSKSFLNSATLFLLVFIVLCSFLTRPSLVHGNDEVWAKILEADNAVSQAFAAVLEAEEAGANVSDLIFKLDNAGRLLAEAETAYRSGNQSGAFAKAEDSLFRVAGVKDEALDLRSSASADARRVFGQTLLFSLVGAVTFVGFLLFVWIRFKRAYSTKLLKMKPEVAPDAA